MRLIAEMYRETNGTNPGLFGLVRDKMGGIGLLQNAGWYNQHGEYLGHGDLGLSDLARIVEGLEEDELFVVMAEYDWRMASTVERNGGPTGNEFYKKLGAEYICRHCVAVVAKGGVFVERRYSQSLVEREGRFKVFYVPQANLAAVVAAYKD